MSATEPNGFTIYAEQPIRGRACGSCTACCTLVPVHLDDEIKPCNQRCKHLRHKGCSIYKTRPRPCVVWNCRWLFDPLTAGLHRPDRCGYVIDAMLDTLICNGEPAEVLQVWVDPRRREAHRDPALRAYLAAIAETYGIAAIVRWSSYEGMVLIAPSLSGLDHWIEDFTAPRSQEYLDAELAKLGTKRFMAPA